MPIKPVAAWTLSDALDAAKSRLPIDYEVNRKMVEEGDHWQGGSLYIGFRSGDPALDAALIKNVEPQFVTDDVVGECVDNRTAGLIGQEADVTLLPISETGEPDPEAEIDDAAQAEIDSVIALLNAWWDRIGFWSIVQDAVDRVSYAGRTTLRAFIPQGKLAGGGLPPVGSLAEALAVIEVDAPLAHLAARYTDPLDDTKHAVVATKLNDKDRAEVWSLDPLTGQVTVKILGEGAGASGPFDLKGRLPLAEAKGRRILTPSARALQNQLNFIATVTSRVVETTGHRERYLGNADPPGMWLPTPPANSPPLAIDDSDPTRVFYKHRVPWVVGANITTELVGLKNREIAIDGSEKLGHEIPSVTALDPVDPSFATNAGNEVSARLYRRMKQGHLALDAIAEASGTAYQQARAQFEADLDALRSPVETLLRDLLEVVLAYAGLLTSSAAGLLDRYRVQVRLHPSAGPATDAEVTTAVMLRDKRAISQSTMQARCGIEDPVVEQDLIDGNPAQQAALWQSLTLALQALMGLDNMTLAGAGFLLGLTQEQLTVLATGLPPEGSGLTLPPEALAPPAPETPAPGEAPVTGNGAAPAPRPLAGAAAAQAAQAARR